MAEQAILAAVTATLEADGYDAVQLRDVARRARVSLTTVYKHFTTREELIVAALHRWMGVHGSAPIAPPAADESVADGLMRVYRHLFEPWERHPRMLEAYHRARATPVGRRLDQQASAVIMPVSLAVLDGLDPSYVADLGLVLTNMTYAVVGRFASGQLAVTEILPTLERAVYRLTSDNAALAVRPQPPDFPASGGRE